MEGLKNVKFIHRNSRFREEFARSQGYLLVYAYWGVRGGKLPDKSGSFPQKKKNGELIRDYNKGTCLYIPNHMLGPQFLVNYARAFFKRDAKGHIKEGQCLLVLDECQLLFNARSWNQTGRDLWCSFFTQHRKFGYKILLISQFDRMLDRQIRSLIENEVKHRKLNNYKLFGQLMGLLYGGSAFIAITYWYGVKEKVSSETFSCKKKYMEMYNSYKIF